MAHSLLTAMTMAALLTATTSYAQTKAAAAAGSEPLARAKFIAQMDAQFRKMDSDGNGQLTAAEIGEFEKQKALAEAQARNRALFNELDSNRNGQLSPTEFAKLVKEPSAGSVPGMLSRADSNRDSQVSLVEHRIAMLVNFDRLDTDKDGVVTATELKAGGIAPR